MDIDNCAKLYDNSCIYTESIVWGNKIKSDG
jgi:hypothetical protein